MKSKNPDVEFLTRTAMALASEPAMERFSERHNVRIMLQALLGELGVRTPYPSSP